MIRRACIAVLAAADPGAKCAAAINARAAFEVTPGSAAGDDPAPDRPARPEKPSLVAPGDVPRRRAGSKAGRIALLHALAHIEFNAIDLAFDMAVRFAGAIRAAGLDAAAFTRDWVRIGAEEAAHFRMVEARLRKAGSFYGALPAHDGLWSAAEATRNDVLARLAVAPMVLEARGLDVTPEMANRLESGGDPASAEVVRKIFEDEIGHVAAGVNWFEALCQTQDLAPELVFRQRVETHFAGVLKPPFNTNARARAGLRPAFYEFCP